MKKNIAKKSLGYTFLTFILGALFSTVASAQNATFDNPTVNSSITSDFLEIYAQESIFVGAGIGGFVEVAGEEVNVFGDDRLFLSSPNLDLEGEGNDGVRVLSPLPPRPFLP